MRAAAGRRGLSAVEVVIGVVFILIVTACLLVAIPRSRERSRRSGCQNNLMQIGLALGVYHEVVGRWPGVAIAGPSPVAAMLDTLAQPDFTAFRDPKSRPAPRASGPAVERFIPGLICPTDRNATSAPFPAPISYRANTGDTTDGRGGPFAIGRSRSLVDVEAADGATFTAAFSERLVGDGRGGIPSPANYALVPGPIGEGGCPTAPAGSWRGDAGDSWLQAHSHSTLYGHLPPPGSRSCIADDLRTAFLGASSDHQEGVHVLLLDGSLRTYKPSVAPGIWRALGTVGEPP
jgi:hypothetical protein